MGAQLPPGFELDAPPQSRPNAGLPPGFEIDPPSDQTVATTNAQPQPHTYINPVLADGSPGVPIDTTPIPGPAPAPPTDPNRGLKIGVQGVGRGVADLLGTPVDLATGAMNLGSWAAERAVNAIPGVDDVHLPRAAENPIGGSNNLANTAASVANALGFGTVDQGGMSFPEKLAYKADELGTNALSGGALLRKLALSRVGNPARKPAPLDALSAPYESGTLKPHIGDVAAGVGSATAVEAGHEYLPEKAKGPLTDFLLSLLGGGGGATIANVSRAPKAAVSTIKDMLPDPNVPHMEYQPATTYENAKTMSVSRGAVDKAARYAQENASDPANVAKTLPDKVQYYRDNDLPVPTVGTLSGDVGLGAVEQGDRVRNPVPYQQADQKVRSAAAAQVRSVAPTDANPRAATEFAGRENKAQSAANAAAVKDAEAKSLAATAAEQATAAPYRNPVGAEPASRALDTVVVDKTLIPRQQAKNAKFAAIPDAERDVTPMLSAAQKVRESLGALNNPSDIIPEATLKRIESLAPQKSDVAPTDQTFKVDSQGVSERVAGNPAETVTTGGKVSFQDMNKLRPELTDAIRAARMRGNYTLADNLKSLKREISAEAERMAAEGSPEAGEALRYFKEDFAPYFGEGTLGGKLKNEINKDTDRVNTPPSSTADRFLNVASGSKEAAADLRKILSIAPDPAAGNKAVRQYVLSDLAKTVDAKGVIDPRRLKDWVAKRADMLSEFPEIDGEMKKLVNDVVNSRGKSNATAAELKKAIEGAKLSEREIQNGALSLLVDSSPDVAVSRVFGANDREKAMRDVVGKLSKDPVALAGWKKAVSDHVAAKVSGTNTEMVDEGLPVQFAAASKFFAKNKDVLQQVYSPEEMNALQKAQKLLEPFGALSRRATVGSPTAENVTAAGGKNMRTLEVALKAYYGVLEGGGRFRTLKLALGALPNSDAQVGWLVSKMQFDPELAQHLMTKHLKDVGTPGWNAKLNRLLGYEAASRASGEPSQ